MHGFRRFAAFLAAALLLSLDPIGARELSLDNGSVRFTVPDEFEALSAEEIAGKFPRGNAPENVVGTHPGLKTTVAYQLKANPVRPEQLHLLHDSLTQTLSRVIPGIEWRQNEIIDLAGQKWIHMELTSAAVDQDIHNVMLVTSHKGRTLMFNFNSTKKEFPHVETQLRTSIKSIVLKP